jgi:hypothetical protein
MKFIQSLIIDSRDRENNEPINNFNINKKVSIFGADYWTVQKVFMTNNIYPINSKNNELTITVGGNTGTISVLPGNYNINLLITEVTNQLNGLGFPTVFSLTYSTLSSRVTINSTTGNITYVGGYLAVCLGFNNPQTGNSLSMTGSNPINLFYTQYLNFNSRYLMKYNRPNMKTDLLVPYMYSLNNNYYSFGASVLEIPRDLGLKMIKWSRDETINNFDIQVYDDKNNLAEMNNSEFVIIINFYRDE